MSCKTEITQNCWQDYVSVTPDDKIKTEKNILEDDFYKR